MSHFGVLCHKGAGHLNPLIALSRQLVARGHRVTFFLPPDAEFQVRQNGLGFVPLGTFKPNCGEVDQTGDWPVPLTGIPALCKGIRRIIGDMELSLREGPAAFTQAGIESLIIDEMALAGPTLAQLLRLPYFVVSTSLPHSLGWSAPRRVAPPLSFFDRIQNALLQLSVHRVIGPVRRRLDMYRRRAELGPIRRIAKVFPELALIAQMPQCLDFPRSTLPHHFHYTGPFVDAAARPYVDFPWERLDGRPVVYASLGTTRKGDPKTFHLIAEACDGLNLQLVISLGGRRDPEMLLGLPGDPLVLRAVPQLELLKRVEIVITHGGLNTALETLMEGKPMIVIPKTFDQPAVAASLQRLRVAEALALKGLSAERIHSTLRNMLGDPSYGNAARELQAIIRSTHGLERAADLIEGLLQTRTGDIGRSPKPPARICSGSVT
jgi:zeaxanthin glucosyltransferase